MCMIIGPLSEGFFPRARLALSVPILNAHIEEISTAPVFASHPFDLQHFPLSSPDEVAHVGPPGANVEVKLIAVDHDSEVDDTQGDPTGKVTSDHVLH
jgi:long-chain acyl-CoA synthetase